MPATWKKTAGRSILLSRLGASFKQKPREKSPKASRANRLTKNMTAKEKMDFFMSEPPPSHVNDIALPPDSPESRMSPEVDQVLSSITDTKEKRIKSAIRDSMMKIKQRVKVIIQNSGEVEDEESKAVAAANQLRSEALKERLTRIEDQKVVLGQIVDYIENCANRSSLLGEVNDWLWKDHAMQEFQQDLEDRLSQTIIENEIDYIAVTEMMDIFEKNLVRMMTLICKLMDETGLFQRDHQKISNKLQIFDETALLRSAEKWDCAVENIASVFEDAIRWLKIPSCKTTLRSGLRQFRQIVQAVMKRNGSFADAKRQVVELKKKVESTKLSKEKMEKEAERMGKKVLQLSEQITQIKTQAAESDAQTMLIEKSKAAMEDKVKNLDTKWREKDKELDQANLKMKQLEEELKKAQQVISQQSAALSDEKKKNEGRRNQGYGQGGSYGQYEQQQRRRRPPPQYGQQNKRDAPGNQPQSGQQDGVLSSQDPSAKMEAWPSPFEDDEDFPPYNMERRRGRTEEDFYMDDDMAQDSSQDMYTEDFYQDDDQQLQTSPSEHVDMMEQLEAETEKFNQMMEQPLAPPPDMDIELYYKNIITTMKQNFQAQLARVQSMQVNMSQPPRSEAEKRRLERFHKDSLPSIQREAANIIQSMENFTESLSGILTREQLQDSLVELQKLKGIISSQMTMVDPLKMLSQMSNRIADYLQKVVDVLARGFLSMRMRTNATATVAKDTPIQMKAIQHQLDNMEEAKQQTMQAFYSIGQLRQHLKGAALRALQEEIQFNPEEVAHKDTKYITLMKRYKFVWGMYNRLQNEVDVLNVDFEDMLENKMEEKEHFIIEKMKLAMREKKERGPEEMYLTIKEIEQNLSLLDRAFEENKIPKKLYSMSVDILHHALSLPEKRVQNLLEKYVGFRDYKDVMNELETEVQLRSTDNKRRKILLDFRKRMKRRHKKFNSRWKKRQKSFRMEKNNVFSSVWQIFNTILLETGLLLVHPLLREKPRLLPPIHSVTPDERRKLMSPYKFLARHCCPELPKSLEGERVRLFGNRGLSRLPNIHVGPASEKVSLDCPKLLQLDVNKTRIVAQRALEKIGRQAMKLSVSQGYIVTSGKVMVLNKQDKNMLPRQQK